MPATSTGDYKPADLRSFAGMLQGVVNDLITLADSLERNKEAEIVIAHKAEMARALKYTRKFVNSGHENLEQHLVEKISPTKGKESDKGEGEKSRKKKA